MGLGLGRTEATAEGQTRRVPVNSGGRAVLLPLCTADNNGVASDDIWSDTVAGRELVCFQDVRTHTQHWCS